VSGRGGTEALVGREREIAALLAVVADSAARPAARSAVVLGPPGIGKSRVAWELGRLLSERGTAVWIGRADPIGRPAPFGVLADVLLGLAGVAPGEGLDARRAKLRARVGRRMDPEVLWETVVVLGEAIGTPFIQGNADDGWTQAQSSAVGRTTSRPGSSVPGGSTLLADLTLRAWEDFLAAELSLGPVVLIVDDAERADLPSMRLFDAALRNLAGRPLTVIALGQPELPQAFPGLFPAQGSTVVRLGELSIGAARELVSAVGRDRLSASSLDELAQRAGGNPFVLEGLARASTDARSGALPQTAEAVAAMQVEASPPETRAVLRAASVLGDVMSRADLQALLEGSMDNAAIERAIADACARGLLAWTQRSSAQAIELSFRSPVVRQAAYAAFAAEDRARAHLAAAQRLADGELDPSVPAWHFEHGGAKAQAIEPYRMAALRALAANDFDQAIARARQAEECGASGATLGEVAYILAEAHLWRGETSDTQKEAQRALGLLPPGGVQWFQAAAAYGVAASRMGNTDALHGMARDVEALVGSRPSSAIEPPLRVAQVIAMSRLSIGLLHEGDVEAAEPLLGRLHALRVAGALDELPFALGFAHRANAMRAHLRGDLLPAFLAFDAAATSFERAGALRDACVDHANAGFLKTELGQNEEAEARLNAALATAMRLGLPMVAANTQLNLCLLMTRRHAPFPAAAMGETALARFEKQGSARMIAATLVYLSRALSEDPGSAAAAHKRAKRAADIADHVPTFRAYAYAARAATELLLGRKEEAVATAEIAVRTLREVGAEEGEAFVRIVWIEALFAVERAEEARSALAEADAMLAARAAKLADPSHRRAFLHNIPEHARIVELAESLGVGATSRAPTRLG
jgi:tetratricopeptide (TPR) repeat protein